MEVAVALRQAAGRHRNLSQLRRTHAQGAVSLDKVSTDHSWAQLGTTVVLPVLLPMVTVMVTGLVVPLRFAPPA